MDNGLEKMMQEKVNEVALILIKECPEIAKSDPKRIGKMAKMMVFDAMNKTIDQFTKKEI